MAFSQIHFVPLNNSFAVTKKSYVFVSNKQNIQWRICWMMGAQKWHDCAGLSALVGDQHIWIWARNEDGKAKMKKKKKKSQHIYIYSRQPCSSSGLCEWPVILQHVYNRTNASVYDDERVCHYLSVLHVYNTVRICSTIHSRPTLCIVFVSFVTFVLNHWWIYIELYIYTIRYI